MKAWKLIVIWTALASCLPGMAVTKRHFVSVGSARTVFFLGSDRGEVAASRSKAAVRPILVDGQIKEWTTGALHNVTDRSFVVRRAIRINDALPTERSDHWIWESGPWLLVDRITGHTTALHLPNFNPAVSEVVWFRDFGAYCGISNNGKKLVAVVSQIYGRRPVLLKELQAWEPTFRDTSSCAPSVWQRTPLKVSFRTAGAEPVTFEVHGNLAVQADSGEDEPTQPQE